jgi:hypothetical protein
MLFFNLVKTMGYFYISEQNKFISQYYNYLFFESDYSLVGGIRK